MNNSDRAGIFLLIVCVIGLTTYGMYGHSLSSGIYEAPAAMMHESQKVRVYGDLVFANETPAPDIILRLFATDEMEEEYVTTDEDGRFYGNREYWSGQLVKVQYNGTLLARIDEPQPEPCFLDYDAQDPYYLGIFVLWW